ACFLVPGRVFGRVLRDQSQERVERFYGRPQCPNKTPRMFGPSIAFIGIDSGFIGNPVELGTTSFGHTVPDGQQDRCYVLAVELLQELGELMVLLARQQSP